MHSAIYIFLLLLVLICLYFSSKGKLFCFITLAILFLIGIFRGRAVGTDHLGYYDDFLLIDDALDSLTLLRHNFELGFVFLIQFFKKYISHSYTLFSCLLFTIFYAGIIKILKQTKTVTGLAILVFYCTGLYFNAYNLMRQMMVIGLLYGIYPSLFNEKHKLISRYSIFTLVVVLFSVLFHNSEIIFLLVLPIHYFCYHKKCVISKIWLLCLVLGSFLLNFIGEKFFIGWIYEIADMMGAYTGYAQEKEQTSGTGFMAVLTLFGILSILYKNPKSRNIEFYIYLLGLMLMNVGNTMNDAGYRLSLSLFSISIVAIPQIYKQASKFQRRQYSFITIIYCLAIFFWQYFYLNSGEISPYYTFYLDK